MSKFDSPTGMRYMRELYIKILRHPEGLSAEQLCGCIEVTPNTAREYLREMKRRNIVHCVTQQAGYLKGKACYLWIAGPGLRKPLLHQPILQSTYFNL